MEYGSDKDSRLDMVAFSPKLENCEKIIARDRFVDIEVVGSVKE